MNSSNPDSNVAEHDCKLLITGSEIPPIRINLPVSLSNSATLPSAREFSAGLAAVKRDSLWGYINERGETVLPFQYRCATTFTGDPPHALVIKGKDNITISLQGVTLTNGALDFKYDSWHGIQNEIVQKWRAANCQISFYNGNLPKFGYFEVGDLFLRSKKYGLVNFLGEYRLPPEYDEITFFPERKSAMAAVRQGNRWGLIGFQAEILAAPQFESIVPQGDKFKVKKNGVEYLVNEKGE